MNIAICEDEQLYITAIKNAVNTWSKNNPEVSITTSVYISAEDLLDDWENGRLFDMIFLDIEFQYMSGFELAVEIRKTDLNIPIVFVTNSNKYLTKGYEISAFRYIKKPVEQNEIDNCLDFCTQYVSMMDKEGFIIQRKGYTIRVPYRSVIYIVSGIHTVTIVTTQNQKHTIPIRMSFEKYMELFPSACFIRCHRGYMVNMMHIERFTASSVTMICQEEIPIGRNYKDTTIKAFQKFFMNEVRL